VPQRICVILGLMLLISVCSLHAGWFPQTSGTSSLLMDGCFTDPHTGWVVGITNTILHTTNGGSTWTAQSSPPSVNYYSVYFTDSLTGCAVGATVGGSGRIRRTTNAGNTWDVISPPGDAYSLWGMYFTNVNNGWIAGGREEGFNIDPIRTIHATTNGGTGWSSQLYQYDSLPLHDVHFSDVNNGCAVGEHGTVFWTTNGGTNWIQRPSPTVRPLWGVYLMDDSTAWTVGIRGTILYTTDSGNNWTAISTDTTCGFGKIIFTDANNGWIAGSNPDSGVILHTSDGGNSWDYQNTGTIHGLISLCFTDSDTGWAVGNIGTILHTTNGGATGIEETDNWEGGIKNWELTCQPNPFRGSTKIKLLGVSEYDCIGVSELNIFDISGRMVKRFILYPSYFILPTTVLWDGKDDDGRVSSPGIYFIRLKSGDFTATNKVILVR